MEKGESKIIIVCQIFSTVALIIALFIGIEELKKSDDTLKLQNKLFH